MKTMKSRFNFGMIGLIFVLLLSLFVNAILVYNLIDSALIREDTRSSFEYYKTREVFLLRLSKSYVDSMSEAEFRDWLRKTGDGLDVSSDQPDKVIVNGVGVSFENGSATLLK